MIQKYMRGKIVSNNYAFKRYICLNKSDELLNEEQLMVMNEIKIECKGLIVEEYRKYKKAIRDKELKE